MASESAEEGAVTVELPPELDEWLNEHAASLDAPREVVIRQLLAAYRTTVEMDEAASLSALVDVDAATGDAIQDQIEASVAATVDEVVANRLDESVDSTVGDRLPHITDAVEGRLDDRFEALDAEFQGKIADVRERVIQLKRELDEKAAADHDHDEFATVDELESMTAALERDLDALGDALEADLDEQGTRIDDVAARAEDVERRLADIEEKLTRVAWVVSDLRDSQGGRDAQQKAVDRIKRAAAQEGISTASCQNCGESVDIGLLTEPQCPHCNSTVSDVRPDGGIFRKKARLVTAAQLEAGPSND
ncbi:ribbon-helix-helix protein, CopG family [Haloarcula marina]|uniref:ribbon-helix-helix protein, CopG family n=1 Tax=Haloarcula marina TaxID=2961574 RepID=UPI0020B6B1CE|nr:ribbon-helix-helix protein, CopG family [Halomicroarcula marina]